MRCRPLAKFLLGLRKSDVERLLSRFGSFQNELGCDGRLTCARLALQ